MTTAVERLLWGDHPEPRRQARRAVVGFATLVLVGYGLFALATRPPIDRLVGYPVARWLFAAVTFYAPPLAAAAVAVRRGGLVAALAVGLVPAVVFGLLATLLELLGAASGDATPWGLAFAFAAFGLAGALAGYAAIRVGRLALAAARG